MLTTRQLAGGPARCEIANSPILQIMQSGEDDRRNPSRDAPSRANNRLHHNKGLLNRTEQGWLPKLTRKV